MIYRTSQKRQSKATWAFWGAIEKNQGEFETLILVAKRNPYEDELALALECIYGKSGNVNWQEIADALLGQVVYE